MMLGRTSNEVSPPIRVILNRHQAASSRGACLGVQGSGDRWTLKFYASPPLPRGTKRLMANSPAPNHFTPLFMTSPVLNARSDSDRLPAVQPHESYCKESLSTTEATKADVRELQDLDSASSNGPEEQKPNSLIVGYWGVSSILGFKERWSLLLCKSRAIDVF